MIFMPRIDLWAIETNLDKTGGESSSASPEACEDTSPDTLHHSIGEQNRSSDELNLSEIAVTDSHSQKASHFWSSFVQQVESICVSTSLMIVATSEVPFSLLPLRIRQFFKDGILDCSSTSSEETIPRFSVDLDGNFNSDAVIDSSAAELLKDLVGEFIQLVHHRTHAVLNSSKKNRSNNTLEGDTNEPIDSLNPGSGSEPQKTQHPKSSAMNLLSTPKTSRSLKIKSSLLMAISTVGYQILRYPHFAELCWVTSKLRDGPSADISGPWRGWPFNSCIVRPNKSVQNGAVACSTSTIKSKESFGLVRGLTAVALSAYRGVYTSLREVSFEVRKVLELLAEEINGKIEAGKDRRHFIRILSQMAYFEDMVNSWAHTLQSFDVDAGTVSPIPNSTCLGSLNVGCIPDASTKSSHEVEVAEGSNPRFDSEKGEGGVDSDTEVRGVTERSPNHMVISPSTPDLHPQSSAPSAAPVQLDLNLPNEPSEVNLGNHLSADRDDGIIPIYSNGFPSSEPVFIEPDGPLPSKSGGTVQNGTTADDKTTSDSTSLSEESTVVCFYSCCSECVFNLGDLLHTILTREWELKSAHTVEDVHDMVLSLLADLNSMIRKRFLAEKTSDYKDLNICACSKDGSKGCHSVVNKKRATSERRFCGDGLDMKFICRDGVLSVVEPDEDVPLHCKFETLCLCSLTEWIEMAKQTSG